MCAKFAPKLPPWPPFVYAGQRARETRGRPGGRERERKTRRGEEGGGKEVERWERVKG